MNTESVQSEIPSLPNLTRLGITVDDRGRAHDAADGRFMRLSVANVQVLGEMQDYILANTPETAAQNMESAAAPVHFPENPVADEASEQVSPRERAKRAARALPWAVMGLAEKTMRKLGERGEKSPHGALYVKLGAYAVVAASVARVYMASRYGYAGAPEKHGAMFDLAAAHLGSTATHHQTVAELSTSVNGAGKQAFLAGFNPRVNTPAKLDVLAGFHPHVSAQERQQLLNELHPGTSPQPPSGPGTIDGFPLNDFVEQGHGVTQEFQDLVNAHGIDLTPQQYYDAYHYVEPIVGGRFFLNDPMYTMPNGDLGISRAGNAVWNPEAVRAYLHWLDSNGFNR